MAKYIYCGDSQTGQSHLVKNGICQDNSRLYEGDGFIVAAVADGLGSSKHSDVASRIAVKSAVDYCSTRIKVDSKNAVIISVIRAAFDETLFEIKQMANGSPDDYDTTLTLAVYIEGSVFYGHVGDSGIIALREDGKFDCVTEAQNGEGVGKDRPTFPLANTAHWIFNKYEYKAKSLFLATDGILNKMMPPLLESQKEKFDCRYLSYLFYNVNKITSLSSAEEWVQNEISAISPDECNHDDKSLIIIISRDVKFHKQPDSYYQYPSVELWNKLRKELEAKLYPYRKDEKADIPESLLNAHDNKEVTKTEISQHLKKSPGQAIYKSNNPKTKQNNYKGNFQRNIKLSGQNASTTTKLPTRTNRFNPFVVFVIFLIGISIVFSAYKAVDVFFLSEKRQEKFENSVLDENPIVIYDGKLHGINITLENEFSGATIVYGEEIGSYESDSSPSIINVEDSPEFVFYKISYKNYEDVEGSAVITIKPYDLSDTKIDVSSQTYTGKVIEPLTDVYADSLLLTKDIDYTCVYKNNVDAGKAEILIIPGNENFTKTKTVSFMILKAVPEIKISDTKFYLEDVDFTLTRPTEAKGVNDVTISGITEWFTTDKYDIPADETYLPKLNGEKVILYWKFVPNDSLQKNYDSIRGQTTFTAQSEIETEITETDETSLDLPIESPNSQVKDTQPDIADVEGSNSGNQTSLKQ